MVAGAASEDMHRAAERRSSVVAARDNMVKASTAMLLTVLRTKVDARLPARDVRQVNGILKANHVQPLVPFLLNSL